MRVTPGVHRSAAEGFGQVDAVLAYERARPSFPADAVEFLVTTLGLGPRRRVADLGAGTGKLTRLLLTTGAHVTAIEPLDEMRSRLPASAPNASIVGGVAEALPVLEGVFDAVVAAQAFHWFDGRAALDEIHGALRAGGRLALVWNARDERVPWVRRLTEMMEPHRGDTPGHASMEWKSVFDRERRFAPLEHAEFNHVHVLGVEGVVDRVASVSFIARLPEAERSQLLAGVRSLAAAQAQPVELPYRTHVYWTERR